MFLTIFNDVFHCYGNMNVDHCFFTLRRYLVISNRGMNDVLLMNIKMPYSLKYYTIDHFYFSSPPSLLSSFVPNYLSLSSFICHVSRFPFVS